MNRFDRAVMSLFGGTKSKLTERQGASGTEIYAGYIQNEDHNIEWKETAFADNVDKMMREDALIKASIHSFNLPILSGNYRIVPASTDNADMKIAEFVEQNLFFNTNFNWNDILRQQLSYLPYGMAAFSKQYEKKDDGKFWLRRLQYLKPGTIERFYPDDDADLLRIEQFAYDWKTQRFDTFSIDRDNLFLLNNERYGNNYRGASILRPIWANYKIKKLLIKVSAIQQERWGVGIPHGEVVNAGKFNKSDLENALESISTHEKSYLISTPEYKLSILRDQASNDSIIKLMNWHNHQINDALNRQYMNLGQSGEGSLALAKVLQGPFFDAVYAVAEYMMDVWNMGDEKMDHIKQLVDENFARVEKYPHLEILPKANSLITDLLNHLPGLASAGLIDVGHETISTIHKHLGLPEPDKDLANIKKVSSNMPPNLKPSESGDENNVDDDEKSIVKAAERIFMQANKGDREQRLDPIFLRYEKRILNLEEMKSVINQAHDGLKKDTEFIVNDMEKRLIDAGMRIFTSSQDVKQLIEKLEKYEAPMRGKLTDMVTGNAQKLFDFGMNSVKEELQKQKIEADAVTAPVVEDQKTAFKSIRETVKLKVRGFVDKILGAWKASIVDMFKSGDFSTEYVRDSVQRISRNKIIQDLGGVLNEAHGLGRNSELLKIAEKDDVIFYRSEILDQNICSECLVVDGREFSKDDAFFHLVSNGPYSYCQGRSLCRGINFVVKD